MIRGIANASLITLGQEGEGTVSLSEVCSARNLCVMWPAVDQITCTRLVLTLGFVYGTSPGLAIPAFCVSSPSIFWKYSAFFSFEPPWLSFFFVLVLNVRVHAQEDGCWNTGAQSCIQFCPSKQWEQQREREARGRAELAGCPICSSPENSAKSFELLAQAVCLAWCICPVRARSHATF